MDFTFTEAIHYSNASSLTIASSSVACGSSFGVSSTTAGTPVTINLAAAHDSVNVSPSARFLDGIQGGVTVNGLGSNTLNVFDQNDSVSHTYTISSSSVLRNASASITYHGMSAVTLDGGSGTETYNVVGGLHRHPDQLVRRDRQRLCQCRQRRPTWAACSALRPRRSTPSRGP